MPIDRHHQTAIVLLKSLKNLANIKILKLKLNQTSYSRGTWHDQKGNTEIYVNEIPGNLSLAEYIYIYIYIYILEEKSYHFSNVFQSCYDLFQVN